MVVLKSHKGDLVTPAVLPAAIKVWTPGPPLPQRNVEFSSHRPL